ncbi:MAG: ATP-binding protein [Bacteroidota bacterium]|nr:ATP-binding protein [Bacteroidota bacterium]
MKARNLRFAVEIALKDTPVVLVNGARQTGKTTMVKAISRSKGAQYVTLDDHATLEAALNDPPGFIQGLGKFAVIDEVQNAPNIFRAIKASVDRDRRPGRFLLTGSANVLVLPKLGDSLAGRMEIISMHPFAQDELAAGRSTFIDRMLTARPDMSKANAIDRKRLADLVLAGGYPEVITRKSKARRSAWYGAYINSILQRDVRDISNITGITDLPRLLNALSIRNSGLLNLADLSRTMDMPHSTLRRYMALLEATFLSTPLPAWSTSRSKRLVKAPKVQLVDSGFASHLAGIDTPARLLAHPAFGSLLENFVVNELRRISGWSKLRVNLFHYRTEKGREVDVVLEDGKGRIVGIEVKASTAIGGNDIEGLKDLREAAGSKWLRGLVLHAGTGVTPFAKDIHAVPVSVLWDW